MKPGVESTLPLVSVFPAPVLRWMLVPPPDPVVVDGLARSLGIPAALAALLVQRGQATEADARTFLRPAVTGLSDPGAIAGMSRGRRGHRRGRAGRRHHPGPRRLRRRRPVRHRAPHPRAPGGRRGRRGFRAAPAARRVRLRARRPRRGAARWRLARGHLRLRHHGGGDGARGAGSRHRRRRHRPPPARAPSCRRRSPSSIRSARTTRRARGGLCGTGIAFKLVQALVPALGLPANLPYHLLDLVALATVADVVPLVGENRILVRHGLKLLADSRWPGLRALVAASGLAGRRSSAPATWASSWARGSTRPAGSATRPTGSGSCSPTIRRSRRAGAAAGGAQRRAPVARPADSRGGPRAGGAGGRSRARRQLRARRRRLAPGRGRHRGVARGRAVRAADVSDRLRRRHRQGLGAEHLAVRPARGAARLRRPARALRRPPDGRRAHHPARPAGRVPRALRRGSPGSCSAPEDLGPEQRVDLELALREATRRARAAVPPPRAVRVGEREPGVRRARCPARPAARGSAAATSRARWTTAPRGSRRSASNGPTGCRGWARAWWTRRSGSSRTSGTGTRRCRRGCARSRRTGDRDLPPESP